MDWSDFVAMLPSTDTVSVQAYAGGAGLGDTWDPPVDVTDCVVQDADRLVPVQTGGAAGKVRSKSACVVFMPPGSSCPVRSKVTLASGRTGFAATVETLTDNGLGLPEHLEVTLE